MRRNSRSVAPSVGTAFEAPSNHGLVPLAGQFVGTASQHRVANLAGDAEHLFGPAGSEALDPSQRQARDFLIPELGRSSMRWTRLVAATRRTRIADESFWIESLR